MLCELGLLGVCCGNVSVIPSNFKFFCDFGDISVILTDFCENLVFL